MRYDFRFRFENGESAEVVKYLKIHQKPDGGFGSALEPDCWNAKSASLQTWAATKSIKEIGFEDKTHPLISEIWDYLGAGGEYDDP